MFFPSFLIPERQYEVLIHRDERRDYIFLKNLIVMKVKKERKLL